MPASTGYARLSNHYWQDRDVLKLRRRNPSAVLLHVLAISWCSDHLTDGRIDLDTLLYVLGASDQDVDDLVASGMLQPDPDGAEDSYMIRSYLRYQNSADDVESKAEAHRERTRRWRERKAKAGDAGETGANPDGDADGTDDGQPCDTPVTRHNVTRDTPVTDNQEPITNNQDVFPNGKTHTARARASDPRDVDPFDEDGRTGRQFAEFWKLYPKKTNRREAQRAFKAALKRGGFTKILAGVTALAADPNLPEARYIPAPARWLAADGWLNPPYPATQRDGPGSPPRPASASARNLEANASLIARFKAEETQQAAPNGPRRTLMPPKPR